MAKIVWGIDIGYSAIKAVKMSRAGATAEIVDFDVAEIEADEDDSTRPMRVQLALRELATRKKIGTSPVVLSIPGNQTFFRPFSLPAVPDKKVAEIVQYEARQQIPFPLEEVYWGWQRYASQNDDTELGVDVVAVRRDIVEQLLATADEVGLSVVGLQTTPLALYNLVRHDLQPDGTVLVLDSGAKETDFLIVEPDHWWVRPLPMSGSEITKVLEQKFRMPFAEAEDLKVKMAESKQAQKIFNVIEPTLRNLAGEVQRTLGYYKSLAKNTKVEQVFATGNSVKLMGLTKFLNESLHMPVDIVSGLQRVRLARGIDEGYFEQEFHGLTVAIGLGLQGLGLGELEPSTELLPADRLVSIQVEGKKPWAIATAAVALATVALAFVAAQNRLGEFTNSTQKIDAQVKAEKDAGTNLKKAEKNIPFKKLRMERYSRIARERGWYINALRHVTNLKGEDRRALIGPKAGVAGVYITEFYMSRFAPHAGRAFEDTLTRFGRENGLTVDDSRRAPPSRGKKAAPKLPASLPPDGPLFCVLVGEIAPKIDDKAEVVADAQINSVDDIVSALQKIEGFKALPIKGKEDGEAQIRSLPIKPQIMKPVIRTKHDAGTGETTEEVKELPYREFMVVWRYDDGADIQAPKPAAAKKNGKK